MACWREFRAIGHTVRYCVVDEHPTAECTDFPDSTGFFVWRLACHALCRLLLSHPSISEGKRILELGAGIALPSACVARLAAVVVATDAQPPVLAYSQLNIEQNMTSKIDQPRLEDLPLPVQRDDVFTYRNAMKLTWGNQADEARLRESFPHPFDVCIASDVLWLKLFTSDTIYEQALQLLTTSRKFLALNGVLIFSYNKRMDGMTVDIFQAATDSKLHLRLVDHDTMVALSKEDPAAAVGEDLTGYDSINCAIAAIDEATLLMFAKAHGLLLDEALVVLEDGPSSRSGASSRRSSASGLDEIADGLGAAKFRNPLWIPHISTILTDAKSGSSLR